MSKTKKSTIEVQGTGITVLTQASDDYISLTDIAKHKEPGRSDHVIQNWMRNRNTVEFLGVWERLNNTDLKPLEFEGFKNRAGLNSFVLTPRQWIRRPFRPNRQTTARCQYLHLADNNFVEALDSFSLRQAHVNKQLKE